jgi:hypothetical protein
MTDIKAVLAELVHNNIRTDLFLAIRWNLEQLLESFRTVQYSFKDAETQLTLLNQNILNPELLDVLSLNNTITEGLQAFPGLKFPVQLTRYQLRNIAKMTKVQFVGHLQFVLIIPLMRPDNYDIYTLAPHPLNLETKRQLVIPIMKEILLTNNETHIVTNNDNIFSITPKIHLLLNHEAIHRGPSCEISAYMNNSEQLSKLCSFKKVLNTDGIYVTDTPVERLAYFGKPLTVTVDCPSQRQRGELFGLHRIPNNCAIITPNTRWPAMPSISLNMMLSNRTNILDNEPLPIINVNETTPLHKTLIEMIDNIQDSNFSLPFNYSQLTLKEITLYGIYSQFWLWLIIIVNICITAYLLVKQILTKRIGTKIGERTNSFVRDFSDRFSRIRSSSKLRRSNEFRKNISRNSKRVRDSLRRNSGKLRNKLRDSPHIKNLSLRRRHSQVSKATNTDDTTATAPPQHVLMHSWNQLPTYNQVIPRYIN